MDQLVNSYSGKIADYDSVEIAENNAFEATILDWPGVEDYILYEFDKGFIMFIELSNLV